MECCIGSMFQRQIQSIRNQVPSSFFHTEQMDRAMAVIPDEEGTYLEERALTLRKPPFVTPQRVHEEKIALSQHCPQVSV